MKLVIYQVTLHTHSNMNPGAGNSVFPLLSANQNPELRLRAYDYSSHAVKLVQVGQIFSLVTAESDPYFRLILCTNHLQ